MEIQRENMIIPYNDLTAHHQNLKDDMLRVFSEHLSSSSFIGGDAVRAFEQNFSKTLGVSHCVGMSNGTDTLVAALRALNLKTGDEVIIPSNTWISTAEAVALLGGVPVFCDVDDDTLTIDVEALRDAVSNKTVGVIPVHLYGIPCEMDSIMKLARAQGIWVLEDCAQAHLATFGGISVGAIGDIGSFSFYPGKNLGALGDAGAITTSDDFLAEYIAMYRNHGSLKKHEHRILGTNNRLDSIQAAFLNLKLQFLPEWTERRREIAQKYLAGLKHNKDIKLPSWHAKSTPVWHAFVIRLENRDQLADYLKENGVETLINYPSILPETKVFYEHGASKRYPVSKRASQELLCLPIYPELKDVQVEYILELIERFFK